MRIEKTGLMQGSSDPNPELLDAAAVCGHLVAPGSVHAFLAEHRHRLFPDEMFADLFASGRGRPSVPAEVIATVMVLQALEGRSDRDAIDQLRTNIAWKVAAGRPLTDEGFHPTVLTLWRNKLRASEHPERIFDAVRAVIAETGVLRGKTRRAIDSTVLDDAVATQDTVTQLISSIRRVRRLVPQAAALELAGHDYADAGKPRIAWDDTEARQALITALVNDALVVLDTVEGLDLDTGALDAVGLLALVAGQDVEPDEHGDGTWRIVRGTARDRVISTVDPDSRHVHKSVSSYRDGYKAHIVVEPATGLICAQQLTAGNTPDGPVGVELMADEPPGRQVLADAAYGSGETRAELGRKHHLAIKPWPMADTGRFGRDDFTVDHNARTATCPAGHTAPISLTGYVSFQRHCNQPCPLRERCTTAKDGRSLQIRPHDAELTEARRAWRAGDFAEDYRRYRPMVERTLAWLVRPGRRVAYRGTTRNRIWLAHRAAAVNLQRLINLGITHHGTWQLAT